MNNDDKLFLMGNEHLRELLILILKCNCLISIGDEAVRTILMMEMNNAQDNEDQKNNKNE